MWKALSAYRVSLDTGVPLLHECHAYYYLPCQAAAPSTSSKMSDYELQRLKNIEENKKLFTSVFGDSVWGDNGPGQAKKKGKGSQKGKNSQCVYVVHLIRTCELTMQILFLDELILVPRCTNRPARPTLQPIRQRMLDQAVIWGEILVQRRSWIKYDRHREWLDCFSPTSLTDTPSHS